MISVSFTGDRCENMRKARAYADQEPKEADEIGIDNRDATYEPSAE